MTPESVDGWSAAGIDANQAVHWHEMGFDLQAAQRAKQHGLTPDTAFAQQQQYWPGAPPGSGLSAGMHFVAVGTQVPMSPEQIRRFHDAGVPQWLLQGYWSANWGVEEALQWALAGVQAGDAALWRARKGASPVDTVRDWWRAGIPFDEAADWIGAGLSPQEAVEQRARGITAEQAAALRALRDQETDD